MSRVSDFIQVFRLYRRFGNSAKHSAKAAWHVAVQKLPF